VVGEGGNVIGMITDRDICIALARRGEEASRVPVWEAMQHKLFTCSLEDDIHCTLKTFRAERICRLPVVDREGVLQGILCMDDIVLTAQPFASKQEISFEDVAITYQAICTRNYPEMIRRAPAA
jgi:predicted transcriptional regulator